MLPSTTTLVACSVPTDSTSMLPSILRSLRVHVDWLRTRRLSEKSWPTTSPAQLPRSTCPEPDVTGDGPATEDAGSATADDVGSAACVCCSVVAGVGVPDEPQLPRST